MNHRPLRFVFASLLPLSIACGGSTGDLGTLGTGPSPSPSGSAAQSDAGPAPAQDAGATTDASTLPSLPVNCNVSLTSPDLCIENAQGHAGDIVDVDVYFVGTSSCTDAYEASGHIVADANSFALANPVQQVSCITRDYYATPAPGTIEMIWNAFGGGSIGACPNDIAPGKLDTVKIEILPGTPPGDYPITWKDAGLAAPTQACSSFGNGIAGFIRVLP